MYDDKNRRTGPLLVVFGIVLTILAITLAQHWRLSDHSLQNNGQWTATKTTLAKRVFGAKAFLNGMQALTFGHLDLAAWHGFQEVVSVRPYAVEDVAFEFFLEPNGWLAFLWDRDQATYSGVRFSVHPMFDTIRFEASELGGFSSKHAIEAFLTPNTWHRAEFQFMDDTVVILIDDQEISRFPSSPQDSSLIAFRGGLYRALVDNISVSNAAGVTFTDSFTNRSDLMGPIMVAALVLLLLNIIAFATAQALYRDQGLPHFHLLTLNIFLLITVGLLYGYRLFGGSLYPIINPVLAEEETRWKTVEATTINDAIQKRYAHPTEHEEHRILVIGTSQTWGAGASRPEDTFTDAFQDRLNAEGSAQFTVINAGISALQSAQLLDLYKSEWIDLGPDTVIINLSNNDPTTAAFEENLMEMVILGNQHRIRTVLVLEPNSIEWVDIGTDNRLVANHTIMRQIAASNDLLLIDMHARLQDRHDDGFLWWDSVHLTSFGQSLFADVLMDELAPTLLGLEE